MHPLRFCLASVALAAAVLATGCADSSTTRTPLASPGALRAEHLTPTAESEGSGPARESRGKSGVAERRSAETRSARSSGGGTRPTDRPPPRQPPPHR